MSSLGERIRRFEALYESKISRGINIGEVFKKLRNTHVAHHKPVVIDGLMILRTPKSHLSKGWHFGDSLPVRKVRLSENVGLDDWHRGSDYDSEEVVSGLVGAYQNGDNVPPIFVGSDDIYDQIEDEVKVLKEASHYWVTDGNHRLSAAQESGVRDISCWVRFAYPGEIDEFYL